MKLFTRFLFGFATSVTILVASFGTPSVHAESSTPKLCFAETGRCINEPFLSYWESNGGLQVFGYPITEPREEQNRDTSKTYLTQWYERARLEYHPDLLPPYNILLGRLGADQLLKQGISTTREQGPQADCVWFAQTGHNVCNQDGTLGFKTYWETHGLQDPKLNHYDQSLALFGYPLTTPQIVTNANGDRVLTQWFERGRFEYHLNNPMHSRVLLGLMGVERIYEGAFTPPQPCQASLTTVPTPVNVSAQPSFCIKWVDQYADEQSFFVILKYLNSGEEFRYTTSANTTQLYIPTSDQPNATTGIQCTKRKDFVIEVRAVRANGSPVVGQMAGEGECR